MDSILARIQETEIMLASIKADLMKMDLKNKTYSNVRVSPKDAATKDSTKDSNKDKTTKPIPERYNPVTFIDEIFELAKDRVFKDGTTKRALCGLPRSHWPLNDNGEEYEKLQHLCEDYNLSCIRDDPEKPTVFIVFTD
jgi:hypothetical protein